MNDDHEFENADEWGGSRDYRDFTPPPPLPDSRSASLASRVVIDASDNSTGTVNTNENRRQAYAASVARRDQAQKAGIPIPTFNAANTVPSIVRGKHGRESARPARVPVGNGLAGSSKSVPAQMAGVASAKKQNQREGKKGSSSVKTPAGNSGMTEHLNKRVLEGPEGFDPKLDTDNVGMSMMRSGEPPQSFYQLPPDFFNQNPEFFNKFFGHKAHNIIKFSADKGTHIAWDEPSDRLAIWGDEEGVERTRTQITDYLKRVDKEVQRHEKKPLDWATVKAGVVGRKREREKDLAKQKALRQHYRSAVPRGVDFQAVGVFYWPNRELAPASLLGANYEAFDDIRFECECYIMYSARRSAFLCKGKDPDKVAWAVDRMYNTFCEVATKNRKTTKMHLVIPPTLENLKADVALNKKHSLKNKQLTVKKAPKNNDDMSVQCVATGPPSLQLRAGWQDKRIKLLQANEHYLRRVVEQVLTDLYYFRGHSKMRIYFGKLVLFAYKRPKGNRHSLEEFISMMRDPQTSGETIRYIGDKYVGIELIAHCDRLVDVFYNVHAERSDNEITTEPLYSATFEIKLEKGNEGSVVCKLEVSFGREPKTEIYRVRDHKWLQIPPELQELENFRRRKAPMEVQFLDLDHDMAYQFEVTTAHYLPEVDIWPIFPEFVKNIRLPLIPDGKKDGEEQSIRRISYVQLPGMTVEAVTQKQKFQYWILNSHYVFEITKYEHLDVGKVSSVNAVYDEGMETNFIQMKPDTRYGASLFSSEWDEVLSKQRDLGRGCVGDWKADIEHFFVNSKAPGFGSNGGRSSEEIVIKQDKASGEITKETVTITEDGFSELLGRASAIVKMLREINDRVAKRKAKERLENLKGRRFDNGEIEGKEDNSSSSGGAQSNDEDDGILESFDDITETEGEGESEAESVVVRSMLGMGLKGKEPDFRRREPKGAVSRGDYTAAEDSGSDDEKYYSVPKIVRRAGMGH